MGDDLLHYYERELTFIREMGAEFARKYPKIAGRLQLEPDKCEDPHTERLIEAFAFLCGRVHKKIDDDFPEITESLFHILFPHYVNPVPSMSVVSFDPVKQAVPPTGYHIARNTPLYSKPVNDTPCQFTTGYPVSLWPVEVVSATLREPNKPVRDAQQALVIQLKTFNSMSVSELSWDNLRFFLNGPGQHVYHIYELLCNNACHVEFSGVNKNGDPVDVPLGREGIAPVGFEQEETLIPADRRSFPGYLLLFEYFCFPEKFLFIDIKGVEKLRNSELTDTVELWIYLDRSAKPNLLLTRETFCLNATPIVNLFSKHAEPLLVQQEKTEYRIIPDIRRIDATEIYSVDSVVSQGIGSDRETAYMPFYSLRHHLEESRERSERAFWHLKRTPSVRSGDDGTEIFLSFADINFAPTDPGVESVSVRVTCTNRDLPGRITIGDTNGDFEIEIAAPVSAIRCMIKPTLTRRPPLGGGLQWRLISHLSLNHLSLVEGGEDALKEILKLYDFDNSPATRQQINGIVSVKSEYATKRVGQSFCRGVQVTITLDEDKFVGTGLFLFATLLERFLGQYVSVNSFSQLVVMTLQRKERLKKWPPRNGNRVLL